MQLRTYQTEAIQAVRQSWHTHDHVLGVAATGSGKTVILLALLLGAGELPGVLTDGTRGLILAHRDELIQQPYARIARFWPHWLHRTGIVKAKQDEVTQAVTIASVQSLHPRRLLRLLDLGGPIDYVVTDEAHHANASSYQAIYEALKQANPRVKHLGVTATPDRGDGNGLGKTFEHISFDIQIDQLMQLGYLVPVRGLEINSGHDLAGVRTTGGDFNRAALAAKFETDTMRMLVVNAHREYAADRKALVFVPSVAGAYRQMEAFQAAGFSAAAVEANTPRDQRQQLLRDHQHGSLQVLVNVGVLTEGYDSPALGCIHMARPTKSRALFTQMVGRGLRPANGDRAKPGEDCLVLEYLATSGHSLVTLGDMLGVPKDIQQAKNNKEAEPGEVQLGFTFDGAFDFSGTPMEIIARQLDYLKQSAYRWFERDGLMVLGMGKDRAGIDRILAMTPLADDTYTLYGLARNGAPHWTLALQQTGTMDDLDLVVREKLDRYGNPALVNKDRSWHSQSATDGQLTYLKRLAPRGSIKQPYALTKAQAADLITYYQARRALEQEGVMR